MLRLFFSLITIIATLGATFTVPLENSKSKTGISARIIGGKLTDISNHPHQISMRYKSCDICPFHHRCGGSIVAKKIIVTTAHCVENVRDPKRLLVVAGANQRIGHGLIAPVEKIISHEGYNKFVPFEYDIAILVLGVELDLNENDVRAIEMAEIRPVPNEIAKITGWGKTAEDGHSSDYLLEVEAPIVSNEFCGSVYGIGKITKNMFCAGNANGGKDSCQEDSGGPLVTKGVLSGVVSFGIGCGRPQIPGVFVSVADLRPWLDAVIKSNS